MPASSRPNVLQLRIELTGSEPHVHLHAFPIEEASYSMSDEDVDPDDDELDDRDVRVADLFEEGMTFVYQYDFGDVHGYSRFLSAINAELQRLR